MDWRFLIMCVVWNIGIVLAVNGTMHLNKFTRSDWQYWGYSLMFGLGSAMMLAGIKILVAP